MDEGSPNGQIQMIWRLSCIFMIYLYIICIFNTIFLCAYQVVQDFFHLNQQSQKNKVKVILTTLGLGASC